MLNDYIGPILTTLLGGGLVTAVVNLYRAGRDNQKTPEEKQSIITEGAEKAVMSLSKALDGAEARIVELREQLEDQKKQFEMLLCEKQEQLDAALIEVRKYKGMLRRIILEAREQGMHFREDDEDL